MYNLTMKFDDEKLAELMPDSELDAPGNGDFLHIGKYFNQLLVEHCGLKEDSVVLDIGCCNGRMAIPMTQILTTGRYEGFDTIQRHIDWDKEHIQSKFPDFNFQRVDVHNGSYNPEGVILSRDFIFPYEDDTFDIALATSVFTHVTDIADIEQYLKETARVLKKGGKTLFTFFLSDDTSRGSNDHFAIHPEDVIFKVAEKAGLKVAESDLYRNVGNRAPQKYVLGSWSNSLEGVDYQDTVYFEKV